MILSLVYLLVLALIVLAAWGVGRPLIHALLPHDDRDEVSEFVWSLAAGLVLVGTLLLGLGLCGLLYSWLIRTLTLFAAAAGFVALGPLWRKRRLRLAGWMLSREPVEIDRSEEPRPWLLGGARWLLAMIAGATLLGALAPPVAGDALTYHLELPKRFLLEHAVLELPHDDNAVYPLLAEMWFLWGLALGGGTVAQLLHWLCGGVLAGGVYLLGVPILGKRWSELAAALTLLAPGVNNQMTAPLNDLAVATLTTLALAAWYRAWHSEPAEDAKQTLGWYLLAGVFLGGALGTKHVALLFVAALGVVTLWLLVRQPQRRSTLLVGSAGLAIVAVSLAGPWYLRAAWHRGDPLYPFLTQLRNHPSHLVGEGGEQREPGEGVQSGDRDSARVADRETLAASVPSPPAPLPHGERGAIPNKRRLGTSALALLTAPWRLTMQPELVGGRAHQLGPLWLMLLPTLIVARRLRGLGILGAIAGVYALQWFLLRQNVRFLLPVVPILAVVAVWSMIEWRRWPRAPRLLATLAVLTIVLFSLSIAVRRGARTLPVAVGIESREAYLRRVEPTYDIARQMHALSLSGARVLSEEQRAFYLPGRITRESIFRRHTQYDQANTPDDALAALRSTGFTHLLLVNASGGDTTYDAALSRLLAERAALAGASVLNCVGQAIYHDVAGGERRYRLVELSESTP